MLNLLQIKYLIFSKCEYSNIHSFKRLSQSQHSAGISKDECTDRKSLPARGDGVFAFLDCSLFGPKLTNVKKYTLKHWQNLFTPLLNESWF